MLHHLSPEQQDSRRAFRAFAERVLMPHAARFDAEELLSCDSILSLAEHGYIGSMISPEFKGRGFSPVQYGLLSEELGRACQSIRNFVAVQDMVAHSIEMWGTPAQKERWLPGILSGETVAAFALTEPDVGSDAATVRTTAISAGADFLLTGTKKWISFAQTARLFLVFAQLAGAHTAFLVERDDCGLQVEPIKGLLGLRGSMLGSVCFDECRVPAESMVGGRGFGLVWVAANALDLGRYSTAWGSVGLAQACLEACSGYADARRQYGTQIKNHQLVQQLLADMVTDTMAARLLCHHAGVSKEKSDVDAVHHTLMAKYRASTVAVRVASDAVQIHGAQGIGADSPAQRHYRDAKVLEIIEGTTQIQQTLIGGFASSAAR
ncbi:acyl-CoA dehydrogenase family protein [Streptomyces sp. 372A]